MEKLKNDLPENYPEYVKGLPVGEIIRSISGIHYGSVQIIIQDSKVIQIDRTEKKRIVYKTDADFSI